MFFVLLSACTHSTVSNNLNKLHFIEVSLVDEETEDVIPFSAVPIQRSIELKTMDGEGNFIPFTGDLKINVRPGQLAKTQDPWISVKDGQIKDGDEIISFQASFGPTRIWVSDEGDKNQDSEREATFATGVSEVLNFEFPTIAQFNKTTDDSGEQLIQNTVNHLVSEFTEVRLEGRDVIATVVSPSGFWVTDLEDWNAARAETGDGGFASLFVYTFSKPEGVVPGARLTKLIGGNQEYLGSTQFSFPAYEVDSSGADPSLIPEPAVLTIEQACNTNNRNYDNHRMESFEAALVKLESATISFNGDQKKIDEFLEYGQWPVTLSDGDSECEMFVDSSALSYSFDPVALDGTDIGPVQGILNQIWSKWIIVLSDDDGIPASFGEEAAQLPRVPTAGPRRAIPRFPDE